MDSNKIWLTYLKQIRDSEKSSGWDIYTFEYLLGNRKFKAKMVITLHKRKHFLYRIRIRQL